VAAALRPRYLLVGPHRLGPLSPTGGLAAAIRHAGDCELLVVPAQGHASNSGLLARARNWFADRGTLPRTHSG
jgi:hypothetical protein